MGDSNLWYVTKSSERARYFNETGGCRTFCDRPLDDILMLGDPRTGCYGRKVASTPMLLHDQTEFCASCGYPIARTWGPELFDEKGEE
jgi:hypothetical protein